MEPAFWGALAGTSGTVAMLFIRFWRDTQDCIFLFSGAAFLVLGVNWAALVLVDPEFESRHYVYVLRLLAFTLILAGIVDKNRRKRTG